LLMLGTLLEVTVSENLQVNETKANDNQPKAE